MGFDKAPGVSDAWRSIYGELTQQHMRFHTSNLHFLPVVTLDKKGRPWSFYTCEWEPGRSVWEGDPFWENSREFGVDGTEMLIAGIGVEVSTRRRNKLAGKIKSVERNEEGRTVTFDVEVNEATGNCPKYIVLRAVEPHPKTHPTLIHDQTDMSPTDRLPSDVISFIHAADTVWLGSAYLVETSSSDAKRFPSHLGINHRGGRAGWVRVKPSDGHTLVLPDYSGNRFLSSLGNIEYTPVASLAIADFKTGDVLYLTGDAENIQGPAAEAIMPMQHSLTTLRVTGYRFIKDALPVRQAPLSSKEEVGVSPYSPVIKYLKEEIEAQGGGGKFFTGISPKAMLQSVNLRSSTIATFTFKPSVPLQILPGQAVILDWKSLLGGPQYRHMSQDKPSLVNDDLIRTWTVSSYHPPALESDAPEGTAFQLTMKEKEGGVVTGALFSIARRMKAKDPELLKDLSRFEIQPGIVGISGDFYLDTEKGEGPDYTGPSDPRPDIGSPSLPPRNLVWGAGGIGFTPFITMLRALLSSPSDSVRNRPWDIIFLLSTREPDVLIPLIEDVYRLQSADAPVPSNIQLHLHVFTSKEYTADKTESAESPLPFDLQVHKGRLGEGWFKEQKEILIGREGYVCGPQEFENLVINSLVNLVGLEKDSVRKEGFAY
ncbi:oxidoreductase FAD/NAD(P)-binding protein [Ephemerocybe angulata]|uniref:Oxidoreductase FAD/NAD(P)-binding protein n=1 Tax=Ephemerocybe angulata TaxID=980116 RepID=A0A8H6MBD9_9AGAR|nr:oxidoreductase FAD/NAD(P)-binding protein [Tulosesus angulatus]